MAKQNVTVELYYAGAWHTVPVYTRDSIRITCGTAPEGGGITPAAATFTIDNRGGEYDPSDPFSVLWGQAGRNTPVRISYPGDVRFSGEATSYKPRRSTVNVDTAAGRGDAWVLVEAYGQLQRLGQGQQPELSAMTRTLRGESLLAWWRLEQGLGAETAGTGPGLVTASPIGPAVVDPLQMLTDGVTGTAALVDLSNGTRIDLPVPEHVLVPATGYTVEFVSRWQPGGFTGGLSVDALRMVFTNANGSLSTDTDVVDVETKTTGEVFTFTTNQFGSGAIATATGEGDVYDGASRHFRVRVYQSGADVVTEMYINGVARTSTTLAGSTLTKLRYISANYVGESGTKIPAVGQVLVYQSATAGPGADAATGYLSERAAYRFDRLCSELGITATIVGDPDDSKPMGLQLPKTTLDLFNEIQLTDDGIVYDTRESLGLSYRTGRSRLVQTPVLDLTFPGDVSPPLEPVIDDLGTRNDVTAKSPTGEARSVDETTSMSVLDPPDGVGRTATTVNVSPESNDALPDAAAWYRYRGTIPDRRYPRIVLDLTAAPAFMANAVALKLGDVATLAFPTRPTARLQAPGYVETIGSHTRVLELVTAPDSLHGNVGVWGGTTRSRWGARTTVLAEDLTPTETGADVNTGTDVWVTTASHPGLFPAGGGAGINVDIGGLTYLCTAITGPHPNLTLTIVRLPDDKAHSAGDQVWVTDTFRWGY